MKIVAVSLLFALLLVAVIAAEKNRYVECLRSCKNEMLSARTTNFGQCFKKCSKTSEENPMSDAQQMDTSALWDRYRRSLFYFIRRKTNGPMTDLGLQMVTEPTDANWDKYSKNLAFIANRVSQYGSIYVPTANTIPKQYEMFLNNLNILNANAPESLKRAHEKFTTDLINLESDMETELNTCATQFEQIQQYSSISFDEYEKLYCGNIQHINENIKKLKGKLVELNSAVRGSFADVYSAISDLITDNTTRGWTDHGALERFINKGKLGQGEPIDYTLSSKTDISESRTWYKKKKSGFLFFKKSSSSSRTEVRLESEHFDMSIHAASFGAIRIYPDGKWLKASIVEKYKQSQDVKNANLKFFGENGSMPMMPLTVYVMFKPSVVLNVSQKDGYFFESQKKSSFTFGPFASRSGSTMTVKKENENNYRVTFETNADEPQIVAIENHMF